MTRQDRIENLKKIKEELRNEYADVCQLVKKYGDRFEYRDVLSQLKGKMELIDELIEAFHDYEEG